MGLEHILASVAARAPFRLAGRLIKDYVGEPPFPGKLWRFHRRERKESAHRKPVSMGTYLLLVKCIFVAAPPYFAAFSGIVPIWAHNTATLPQF